MNAPAGDMQAVPEALELCAVRDGLAALARLTLSADDPPPLWQVSVLIGLLATQMECAMQALARSEH